MGILYLLIWLVVVLAALAIVYWGITQLGLPQPPMRVVAVVLLCLVALVALVYLLVGAAPAPRPLP